MRVFHTSDWHLGKTTWNKTRVPDHEAVLAEIVSIAAEQQPSVILHTGDLFDQHRPPVPALQLATDTLRSLAEIAPVVVVAGNHDSAPFLHWLNGVLRHERISIVADPDAARVGAVLRTPVDSGRIHIAALPFITANRIVNALDDPTTRRLTYAEHIADLQHDLLRRLHEDFNPDTDVSILATHQYVSGSTPSRTENPNHTCDFYATDPQRIPHVDYAAFGHIHQPQVIRGSRVIGAYAGSPIQLDFGERNEDKSVMVVDLHPGRPAEMNPKLLRAGRRLEKLVGTVDELRVQAASITDEICQIVVNTPSHEPGLVSKVATFFPQATIVSIQPNPADRKLNLVTAETLPGAEPDNISMFSSYLAERGTPQANADQVLALFTTLINHIDDEAPAEIAADELLAEDPNTFAVPAEHEEAIA